MASGGQPTIADPLNRDGGRRTGAIENRVSTETTYHELLDGFLLELSGSGGRSIDQLRAMYDRYRIPEPDREPDIRCTMTTDEPEPGVVLGWPKNHYGRDDDRFVIGLHGSFLTVDAEWTHLSMSPDWEPYYAVYVIEFELRRRLAPAGWALLHGSGFQFNGETVLCPSLRGAGKTNTLLSVLQAGGRFLSDDRVWVNGRGTVRGYPLPINPHTEQYQSFPELPGSAKDLRARVADFLDGHLDRSRSILDKAILFLSAEFLVDDDRSFQDINDLLPDATYVPEADVDRVALLRAAPTHSAIEVEAIDDEALSRAFRLIHHYEWNGRLTEYLLAFDALFPAGDKSTELDRVRSAEQATFAELIATVPTDVIKVPRERNWHESGLREEILRTLDTLTVSELRTA